MCLFTSRAPKLFSPNLNGVFSKHERLPEQLLNRRFALEFLGDDHSVALQSDQGEERIGVLAHDLRHKIALLSIDRARPEDQTVAFDVVHHLDVGEHVLAELVGVLVQAIVQVDDQELQIAFRFGDRLAVGALVELRMRLAVFAFEILYKRCYVLKRVGVLWSGGVRNFVKMGEESDKFQGYFEGKPLEETLLQFTYVVD